MQGMRGRRFPRGTQETVSRAAKLGMDPTLIEAISGISKRQIQRIVSKERHGGSTRHRECGERSHQRILKSEHLEVSNKSLVMAVVHLLIRGDPFPQFLKACISRNQSSYLRELKCELSIRFNFDVSIPTISRALNEMGYTRKKVWCYSSDMTDELMITRLTGGHRKWTRTLVQCICTSYVPSIVQNSWYSLTRALAIAGFLGTMDAVSEVTVSSRKLFLFVERGLTTYDSSFPIWTHVIVDSQSFQPSALTEY